MFEKASFFRVQTVPSLKIPYIYVDSWYTKEIIVTKRKEGGALIWRIDNAIKVSMTTQVYSKDQIIKVEGQEKRVSYSDETPPLYRDFFENMKTAYWKRAQQSKVDKDE